MYAGPGSGSMLAAAAAWNGLASDLYSAANNYGSVIADMTGGSWRGPAAASMAAAAAPYVAWMGATAAQAAQAASQAMAAAAAYEAAFAMMVPPPVIAANRALLATLVATNVLGQNTPAIAATEAHYGEMWAQDAAAMYGYAGSSAAATRLTQFTMPVPNTNPAGLATQSGAVAHTVGTSAGATTQTTLSQLTSAVPSALQNLTAPATSTASSSGILDVLAGNGTSTTGVAGLFNDIFSPNGLGLNSNFWNTIFSSGFYMPGNYLGTIMDVAGFGGAAAAGDIAGDAAAGAAAAEGLGSGALAAPLGGLGGMGAAVSAGVGHATSIGPLSVPPSWAPPVPSPGPLASTLGATPLTAPPVGGVPGMPGLPVASAAANGMSITPKYGFRPTVVVRPPAAG